MISVSFNNSNTRRNAKRNAYYTQIPQYHYVGGAVAMSFTIRTDRKETENKTIRFPVDLIQEIESAIQNKDVSFSSFVIQACRFALDNIEE